MPLKLVFDISWVIVAATFTTVRNYGAAKYHLLCGSFYLRPCKRYLFLKFFVIYLINLKTYILTRDPICIYNTFKLLADILFVEKILLVSTQQSLFLLNGDNIKYLLFIFGSSSTKNDITCYRLYCNTNCFYITNIAFALWLNTRV